MKSILCVLTLLPGILLACPNLSGTYKNCINHFMKVPREFEVTIHQSNKGEKIQYSWEVLKGQPLVFQATCKNEKLVSKIPEGIYETFIENDKLMNVYFPGADRKKPTVITCYYIPEALRNTSLQRP